MNSASALSVSTSSRKRASGVCAHIRGRRIVSDMTSRLRTPPLKITILLQVEGLGFRRLMSLWQIHLFGGRFSWNSLARP